MLNSLVCISIYENFTFLSADLYSCTAGFALKNYPNLTFNMLNSQLCISIYGNFTFMSADLYSCTADLTSPSDLSWKSNPNWCLICCILTYTDPQNLPNHTKPYQTKPNDLKLYVGIPNKVPSNFWPFLHVDLGPKLSVFI